MAAADVEVAYVALARVDTGGAVFFGDTPNRTISQNINYTSDFRMLYDPTIPETAGNPDIKTYLKAMASRASAHVPVLVSNTMVVTRKTGT